MTMLRETGKDSIWGVYILNLENVYFLFDCRGFDSALAPQTHEDMHAILSIISYH